MSLLSLTQRFRVTEPLRPAAPAAARAASGSNEPALPRRPLLGGPCSAEPRSTLLRRFGLSSLQCLRSAARSASLSSRRVGAIRAAPRCLPEFGVPRAPRPSEEKLEAKPASSEEYLRDRGEIEGR